MADVKPLIHHPWFLVSDPFSGLCDLTHEIYDSYFLYRILYSIFTMSDIGFPIPPIKSPISKFWELLSGYSYKISDIWFPVYSMTSAFGFMKSMSSRFWSTGAWYMIPGFWFLGSWHMNSDFLYFPYSWCPASEISDSWFPIFDSRYRISDVDLWLLIPDFKNQGMRVSLFPFS